MTNIANWKPWPIEIEDFPMMIYRSNMVIFQVATLVITSYGTLW